MPPKTINNFIESKQADTMSSSQNREQLARVDKKRATHLRITCTKLLIPRQYGKIFDGAKDRLITHRLHIPIIFNDHQFNRRLLKSQINRSNTTCRPSPSPNQNNITRETHSARLSSVNYAK